MFHNCTSRDRQTLEQTYEKVDDRDGDDRISISLLFAVYDFPRPSRSPVPLHGGRMMLRVIVALLE
jgi:hypothetical protein